MKRKTQYIFKCIEFVWMETVEVNGIDIISGKINISKGKFPLILKNKHIKSIFWTFWNEKEQNNLDFCAKAPKMQNTGVFAEPSNWVEELNWLKTHLLYRINCFRLFCCSGVTFQCQTERNITQINNSHCLVSERAFH